jgi:hypothetical protein
MPNRMNSGAASGQKYGTQKNARKRRVRKAKHLSELETDEETQNKIIFNCFIFLLERPKKISNVPLNF